MLSPRGTLLVGQSGGPTAVINASLAGILLEAKRHRQIERVVGMVNGLEGALRGEVRDLGKESKKTLNLLRRTPGAILGSCRRKLAPKDVTPLFEVFRALGVRFFIYAGGNDSMDTCARVKETAKSLKYPLGVIGVPKTIDNDLAHTDHCPGYGTAARFVAQTMRDSGLDLIALRTFVPVMVTEILGRHTGWLTAAAGLAKEQAEDPPNLLYVPERVFEEEMFLSDVEQTYRKLGYAAVAVSEGIRDRSGEFVGSGATKQVDAFGHQVAALGRGVGPYLADLVRERLRLQARCNRPGTILRVSSAHLSATDVAEAEMVGGAAVRQLVSEDDGYMVTLVRGPGPIYRCATGLVALPEVANVERPLPTEYLTPDGTGTTPQFVEYALPLIGGPLPPVAHLAGPTISVSITP